MKCTNEQSVLGARVGIMAALALLVCVPTSLVFAMPNPKNLLAQSLSNISAPFEVVRDIPIQKEEAVAALGALSAKESVGMATEQESKSVLVAARGSRGESGGSQNATVERIKQLVSSGKNLEASRQLFDLTQNPAYASQSAQIRYILGLVLMDMKLYQPAAFIFYDVVREESKNPRSKYLRQSLEKISIAADAIDSDVLLKFAITKVDEKDFPDSQRDMLYFRSGEAKLEEKQYREAARNFLKVPANSLFYPKAKYNLGLALAEAGDLDGSRAAFDELLALSQKRGITDRNRVDAIMAKARVLYQKKDFTGAIDWYHKVPRDTEQWHEAEFESAWAMLRSARFRAALSNFHSLHSPYYDDFYQPESLLLRAIVYLYICRYDELTKVLELFERVYKPVQSDVRASLETDRDPIIYYQEITKVADNFDAIRSQKSNSRSGMKLPFIVARAILREPDIRKTQSYLTKLGQESKTVAGYGGSWANSGIGKYSRLVIEKRVQATRAFMGKLVRRHLILVQSDLRDLFEQVGFLKFEMTSGKKEAVKKELQGKSVARQRVDQEESRDYYIQNGFEYWPFKGEYWLDEIGNYHYLGVQACE